MKKLKLFMLSFIVTSFVLVAFSVNPTVADVKYYKGQKSGPGGYICNCPVSVNENCACAVNGGGD